MNERAQTIKTIREKMNILLFLALLLFFGAVIALTPVDAGIEKLEHRAANKVPALSVRSAMNGGFAKGFEAFIADQVGFRTDFIMISKGIERAYGFTPDDEPRVVNISVQAAGTKQPGVGGEGAQQPGVGSEGAPPGGGSEGAQQPGIGSEGAQQPGVGSEGAQLPLVGSETGVSGFYPEHSFNVRGADSEDLRNAGTAGSSGISADTANSLSAGSSANGGADNAKNSGAPTLGEDAADGQSTSCEPVRAGPLLAFPDRLLELFGYSEGACIRYADVVNDYAKALKGKARVFSLITPTQVEFVDEKYKSLSDSEYDAISLVYNRLKDAAFVDAYSYISAHIDEYVYFRTDHHWTALGAYYAYLAFCGASGTTPVTIDKYTEHALPGFLGYLFSYNPTDELRSNPDTIVYYELKETMEVSNRLLYKPIADEVTYSIFIGGDSPIYTITTSVENGRTCLIIKDSFGNAFVPWLAPNYEKIIVIDPRTYKGSVTELLGDCDEDDTDVIILNSASSVGSGGFNNYISNVK